MAQGWASRTYPLSRTAMYHRRLWLRNRTPWLKGRLCVTIRMSPEFKKVKSPQKVFSVRRRCIQPKHRRERLGHTRDEVLRLIHNVPDPSAHTS
jgi:hypothetical protein